VEAFDQVMKAYRDKSLSDEERRSAIQVATVKAGEVPLAVARSGQEVLELAAEVVEIGNVNAVTDAAAAAIMAESAIQIAALNVRINAVDLEDRNLAETWLSQVEEIQQAAAHRVGEVKVIAAERGGY
jgi:formiminotetrahydrofolate cyclodeaminase